MFLKSPKTFVAPFLFVSLVACGDTVGSYLETPGNTDSEIDATHPDKLIGASPDNEKYAFNVKEGLVANNITSDSDKDMLRITNLPHDADPDEDDHYGVASYERTRNLASGWGLYENVGRGKRNLRNKRVAHYRAVYKASDSGNTEGGAVASTTTGKAGLGIKRNVIPVDLPVEGIVKYTGTYGATREITNTTTPKEDIVIGNAEMDIDFNNLDVSGDVVGVIRDRAVYDAESGALLGTLDDVSLTEGRMDREDATIKDGVAGTADGTMSGNWEGVLAGRNGEEIAAYVVMDGKAGSASDVDARELGVILVKK